MVLEGLRDILNWLSADELLPSKKISLDEIESMFANVRASRRTSGVDIGLAHIILESLPISASEFRSRFNTQNKVQSTFSYLESQGILYKDSSDMYSVNTGVEEPQTRYFAVDMYPDAVTGLLGDLRNTPLNAKWVGNLFSVYTAQPTNPNTPFAEFVLLKPSKNGFDGVYVHSYDLLEQGIAFHNAKSIARTYPVIERHIRDKSEISVSEFTVLDKEYRRI